MPDRATLASGTRVGAGNEEQAFVRTAGASSDARERKAPSVIGRLLLEEGLSSDGIFFHFSWKFECRGRNRQPGASVARLVRSLTD